MIGEFFLKNRSGITVTSVPVSNLKLTILLQIAVVTLILACQSVFLFTSLSLIFPNEIDPKKWFLPLQLPLRIYFYIQLYNNVLVYDTSCILY